MESILSKKIWCTGLISQKNFKVLQAEVSRRAEATTSSYFAAGHFSQCG